ncbi:AAA family ATPase [Bacillus sp. FJAT-27264]|uniref:DNA topology modulation protein n=1 Tax=Paenibacillus sp. (strain DSM 101736 / FJAT-27264) TaxID=1850362 RepID=UPI000807D4BF|nr:DNA topology modulation protein [Bacillus sp. FJAT-27264]OBZ18853.1 AAA family ATPase [Bacillus sp. FJAT-27264]
MQRILIVGSAGAGKSTLSRKLGEVLGIPVVHLDKHYWKPGWVATEKQEWNQIVVGETRKEQWIMDGNYSGTLDLRIERADTVIFLDMPRWLCLYRIFKRRIQYHGRTRPDLDEGCPEQLDLDFVLWVWNFPKRSRDKIVSTLKKSNEEKNVIVLSNRRKVSGFLEGLSSEI